VTRIAEKRSRLFGLIVFAVALLGCALAPSGSWASGRVFDAGNHARVCRELADIAGVFGVWCVQPEFPSRELDYHIVIRQGAPTDHVAEAARDILAAEKPEPEITSVVAVIWTYNDPTAGRDFRNMLTEMFPSPIRFPDYRGQELAVVTGRTPGIGSSAYSWRTDRVAPGRWADPWEP
jgi:hypothetical protein